jgi:hypothetical protein
MMAGRHCRKMGPTLHQSKGTSSFCCEEKVPSRQRERQELFKTGLKPSASKGWQH